MKKILLLLAMIITVSCSPISTPGDKESSTPTFALTETPLPQASLFVQLKYPNHKNCTLTVDTRKWELTDEGKKSIGSFSGIVSISYPQGIGQVTFAKHKNYVGCELSWIPHEYRGGETQKQSEIINGKTWEFWKIDMLLIKIYSWRELREIQFVQTWPLDIPQTEGCQTDIYEMLGSLECE